MTTKGTTVDLPAKLSLPEKRMLKQYEGEAEEALRSIDRSAASLGHALWDIRHEELWRGQGHDTFMEWAVARFPFSRSTAYRCIQLYEWTVDHPSLPVPAMWELEPGKALKKNAPKSSSAVPSVGHGPQPAAPEAEIVDAEWSDEIPSGFADPGSAAQLPQRTPVVDLMENLESSLAAAKAAQAEASTGEAGGDESDIGHVTEQWTSEPAVTITPTDVLARLAETKPNPPTEWFEGPSGLSSELAENIEAYVAGAPLRGVIADYPPAPHVHSTQATIDALILLLTNADLEAMGAAMSEDQVDTVMRAAETIRDAHAIATKPREKLSKGQRAKAGAPVAKVTAPSSGGLNRREVQTNFKTPKAAK